MSVGSDTGNSDQSPLYAKRKKVYPQGTHGTFRTIKWVVLIATLGVYYLLPFVRWDRGPNAPDQAVLIDLPGRRFYFFMVEIWPQEVYYITGLLILASLTLFLMNAVAGRLWCGYMCPQTVWTDLFYRVEQLIEGDRRERMKLDKGGWTLRFLGEKAAKHFIWLMIAWWTGGAWVLYFSDAPTLVVDLATGAAPLVAYIWIAILTFTTYTLAGHMREQVCVYMCPWPRIQGALTDEHALNVTYRYDRGEPRESLKSSIKMREKGQQVGDCVECNQCVAVCPVGIDIRDGAQFECIQCGLCIDACDNVMQKITRPRGLIGYDTDDNIKRRIDGKLPIIRLVRPRTAIYAALIALVGAIMMYSLATRDFAGVNVLHDRNPIFVKLSDGGVRNGFTVRLLNKRPLYRQFLLNVEGLPAEATVQAIGVDEAVSGRPVIDVGPDRTREIRVLIIMPTGHGLPKSTPITFRITDINAGEMAKAEDFFKAP